MKNIRPGTATVGVLAVFFLLSAVSLVGRQFGETPVSPHDAVGKIPPEACLVELECKPQHGATPTPIAAKGQPTLAFPTALKLPPRGIVIEVPVEVEFAPGEGS